MITATHGSPPPGTPDDAQPPADQPVDQSVDQSGPTGPGRPRRRGRTVMWAALAMGVVLAVLIAIIASSKPSSEVEGKSPLLGHAAPPIAGGSLAGLGHITLGQFHGKWVLVNFMATWCQPCLQEMPQLQLFYRQHAQPGDATVLTVADDSTNVGQLREFLASKGAKWPAVNDPEATVTFGVQGLPTSFLVAPNGAVYAYLLGEVRASELDNWLQQGAAAGYGPA
jgi:thiol-disulfide isomerase/thioredoxin